MTFAVSLANHEQIVRETKGSETEYEIVLNDVNAPSGLTSSYGNGDGEARYTVINYENARLNTGYHVELAAGGLLYNPLSSQITTIKSIYADFETSGSLSLATSYDGNVYSSTVITNRITNSISSKPYYFKLVANEENVRIKNVIITYSCVPHEDVIVEDEQYGISFSYSSSSKDADISSALLSKTVASGDFSLTGVTGSKAYSVLSGQNSGIRIASGSGAGSVTFSFNKIIKFDKIIVDVEKYDNATVKITSSSNTSGITFSVNSSRSSKTLDFTQSTGSNSLTISSNKDNRFYLYKITLVVTGSVPVIETGISASDSKAGDYRVGDVYGAVNSLSVRLNRSSGPAVNLNYDATGVSGYTYVLKNSGFEIVSASESFVSAGTYFVEVSYHEFKALRVRLTVSEALPPAVIVSLNASENRLVYAVGDIYVNSNQLTVTAFYSDSLSSAISYDPTGENGYTFYFLDQDLNEFYPQNPFASAGEYIFTVSYQGIESNEIIINVGAGSLTEAYINIKTNSISDSTIVTSTDLNSILEPSNISISGTTVNTVFGGAGNARLRLSSGSVSGSLKISFANQVIIQGVSLDVGTYNGKTSGVKVTTSVNAAGQSMTVSDGVGKLTYTAFSSDYSASDSVTVSSPAGQQFYLYKINLTVYNGSPVKVTGISLSDSSLSLGKGKTRQVTASVLPTDSADKSVVWSSGNTSVASVSEGLITALEEGNTVITATTVDGGFSASLLLTVTPQAYDQYYRAGTVDASWNLQDLMKVQDLNAIPTDRNETMDILVIPMELTDYPFTSKTLADIGILFNGTGSETNYWESVKSFYNTSSYGSLDFNFTVTPKYNTGYTAAQAASLPVTSTQYFSRNLLRNAVADYKTKNGTGSTQTFDSDTDGFIDAVWMIYSAPNYSNSTTIKNISTDYWAYVFWDYDRTASVASPVQNVYGWASYDFMYEGGGTGKVDAHTFIHETGHLLGLEDYYNYDDDSTYKPMGGVAMMDYNITDHDIWSKMVLGWQKPYVVTGDAEITISPAEAGGDAILITDSWNGTSFDEFLLLELYTPDSLNALDSNNRYTGSFYPYGYTIPGIRMMHVDSRIAYMKYASSKWSFDSYKEPAALTVTSTTSYNLAHSNTPSYSVDPEYRLIHMIQSGGVNTFMSGGWAGNDDLFRTGQSFSMASYGNAFFKNKTKLNNGNTLPYTIEFVSVTSSGATIRISRI